MRDSLPMVSLVPMRVRNTEVTRFVLVLACMRIFERCAAGSSQAWVFQSISTKNDLEDVSLRAPLARVCK
jgi:hypothetical protein